MPGERERERAGAGERGRLVVDVAVDGHRLGFMITKTDADAAVERRCRWRPAARVLVESTSETPRPVQVPPVVRLSRLICADVPDAGVGLVGDVDVAGRVGLDARLVVGRAGGRRLGRLPACRRDRRRCGRGTGPCRSPPRARRCSRCRRFVPNETRAEMLLWPSSPALITNGADQTVGAARVAKESDVADGCGARGRPSRPGDVDVGRVLGDGHGLGAAGRGRNAVVQAAEDRRRVDVERVPGRQAGCRRRSCTGTPGRRRCSRWSSTCTGSSSRRRRACWWRCRTGSRRGSGRACRPTMCVSAQTWRRLVEPPDVERVVGGAVEAAVPERCPRTTASTAGCPRWRGSPGRGRRRSPGIRRSPRRPGPPRSPAGSRAWRL